MMLKHSLLSLRILLLFPLTMPALEIREDFREIPAHIPVTDADLTSPFLKLRRIGEGADQLKLSNHPPVKNDPYYIWNGQCAGPVLIGFEFQHALDLSDPGWRCHLRTKNVGPSRLHLALQVNGKWIVQKAAVTNQNDWNVQSLLLTGAWRSFSMKTHLPGKVIPVPHLDKVTGIGFAAPKKPDGSKSCIRLDWFELSQNGGSGQPVSSEFLEPNASFLRTALTVENGRKNNRVRRGVLVPLGENFWACFDPDLLRWAAFWRVPDGKAPITYDSMAAISYPHGTTKAKSAPTIQGDLVFQTPELPGFGADRDRRASLANDRLTKVGPLPPEQGRWLGLSVDGHIPVLNYLVEGTAVTEFASLDGTRSLQRNLTVAPHARLIRFRVGDHFEQVLGEGGTLKDTFLTLPPSKVARSFVLAKQPIPIRPHRSRPAESPDQKHFIVRNPPAQIQGSFTIRPIAIPAGPRVIRPTDLAFLGNGNGLLCTLDGDLWMIEGIESRTAKWTRIATGIFEPISIETTRDDRIFVLGRDQVTELIDRGGDATIEEYRNASDAFQQTLQTRDYATSLAVLDDGSFLVAKGGIHNEKSRSDNELSNHRGAIVHLGSDGISAEVLADGLRLPYVGLRRDGAIFASDQQGNYVPSTPLHLIGKNHPFLGHAPTNFQNVSDPVAPLLWYPYQANRSGAAFATTSRRAFPDLGETFLQISWGGRLFAIETPRTGQPFSWQLPLQLDFPSLNGTSHPKSGRLYVTGLGISGYKPTTPELIGLASIEQTSPLPSPVSLDVRERGIEVVFNRPLAADETIIPGSPALRLFDIRRSPQYGSGHFKWDGEPGEHRFQPTSFTISDDRRTLRLDFDPLHRSEILDLSLTVTSGPRLLPLHLFSRPAHLAPADDAALREMSAREEYQAPLQPGNARRGRLHFTNFACAGCHSLDATQLVGPPLAGLASRADHAAISQAILDPNVVITEGYPASMPSFAGVLSDQELADLLAYLGTLRN